MRNSKIELFRILAAFSVLAVHFNGWFLGGLASKPDLGNSVELGQSIIASLFVVCVNCFILISGFFGVHLRLKSVWKFIIQLLGIFVPMYLLSCLSKVDSFSVKTLAHNCFVISRGGYFVQCYFLLLLISPLLNPLFEQKKRNATFLTFVLVLTEFWLDAVMKQEAIGFGHGYQALHFIVMYCCGRCISLYKEELLKVRDVLWIVGYFVCTFISWVLYVSGVSFALTYSSLFVIGSSVCLFIPFLRDRFENKVINWIASGSFAVYIVQFVNPGYYYLCRIDTALMSMNTYPMYLMKAAGVIVVFFMGCVLYDKVRQYATRPVDRWLYPRIECFILSLINKKHDE